MTRPWISDRPLLNIQTMVSITWNYHSYWKAKEKYKKKNLHLNFLTTYDIKPLLYHASSFYPPRYLLPRVMLQPQTKSQNQGIVRTQKNPDLTFLTFYLFPRWGGGRGGGGKNPLYPLFITTSCQLTQQVTLRTLATRGCCGVLICKGYFQHFMANTRQSNCTCVYYFISYALFDGSVHFHLSLSVTLGNISPSATDLRITSLPSGTSTNTSKPTLYSLRI